MLEQDIERLHRRFGFDKEEVRLVSVLQDNYE